MEHNGIISLRNVDSQPIVFPKSSSQGLDLTSVSSILSLILSHGLINKQVLPESTTSSWSLNQVNILLMVGSN